MDDRDPTSDRLRRLASRYEAGVGRGRAEQIAARAITRAHRRSSVGRRIAVAVSSGAFMLVSMTGVGVAADRAVPGDFLYPLDRALEALGFSSDLVEERLLEAITLADRGHMALAIETANEALAELGRSGVTATLPMGTQELAGPTTESDDESTTTTTESDIVSTTTLSAPTDTQLSDEPQETVDDDEPETTVVAAAEPADAVATLRLAAEQLLQSVRSAKSDPSATGDVTSAAMFLAETTAGASSNEESSDSTSSTTTSSSTTSTTTSSSTTSTTVPDEPTRGNGNDQNSGTTTTTVASDPDDGSGSDDSTGDGEGDPPGPIFLPTP